MKKRLPLFLASILTMMLLKTLPGQVVINEYSASNLETITDNYGQYEDWIELYNSGDDNVDLGGYFLSDDPQEIQKWQFPDGSVINAGSFLRIWTTGRNEVSGTHFHTNFKLTQTKDEAEHIVLSDQSGEVVEDRILQITQKGHSRGRTFDGGVNWGIFTNPTPNNSNNSANNYSHYASKPVVSDTAGYYTNPLNITFTTEEPNSNIYYTVNGDEPTTNSTLFSGAVLVDETQIVIARTFSNDPDVLPSLLEFNTYFLNEEHTMGVMSLSAANLDNLLNGNQSLRPFGTFEYFNEEGQRTTFGYGEFNEHGQDSWVHDQRSIDYISRDECGYNYAIREELIPLTDRDEFQRIILRAAGDDNYPGIDTSAHLRDYFVQNTAQREGMHLDVRKGHKGVLYANGIYWGVYGYREKVSDHDFTSYYYNQGKYEIYYLKLWGGSWAEYGGQAAWDDWNDLHNFIKFNDMSVESNFEYVTSRLDYKSLTDYIHINSFVVCSDWINWNVGWWRGINPEGGHQKWGYVLWDEDATFAHYINYTGVPGISPYTSPCYPEGLTSDPEEHIVMLNHLLDNDEFRNYFINRYIDLYNTAFQPDRMISYLNTIEDLMAPEMPQHTDRWGGSFNQWQNNIQKIRSFIQNRHAYLANGLEGCYDLTGPYELNIVVDPPDAGTVRINSLELEEPYWGGMYFGGTTTELEAFESNLNFEFSHWELYNHTLNPSDTSTLVTLDLTTGDFITAVFSPVAISDSLVINEINYNADGAFDCEDWVEFYNPHDYVLDIGGWQFKDDDDEHVFEFPENTVIPPFGYLVLSRDTAVFNDFFPDVENVIGDLDFGFSSSGELIRLFNEEGVFVDTVHYDNNEPWPTEPDGDGPTLELKQWDYDNALPESWIASADHGTPGDMNGYIVAAPETTVTRPFSFVLYPNPSFGKVILQVTSDHILDGCRLTISDIYGNVMFEREELSGQRFEWIPDPGQAGIYICTVIATDGMPLGQSKLMLR